MDKDYPIAVLADATFYDQTELELRHPRTGVLTGWKIMLAGPSHPSALALRDRQTDRLLQRQKEQEVAQVNRRKYKGETVDADELRKQFADDTAALILGWSPVDFGAGPISFSREKAVEILLTPSLGWVASQIREYLDRESAFTTASATA